MKGMMQSSRVIGMLIIILSLMVACSTPQYSPTATPSPTPTAGGPEWDYVALGESITFGVTARYAEILEQDLGVTIIFHDRQVPGDHSSILLERLRTNEQLRQELGEAEVITFLIPLGVIAAAIQTYDLGDPGACGGEDNQDCLREAFATYRADTDGIIAEIVTLRSPSEALIRMQDIWQLKVRETQQTGSFEIFNGYWREANAHVIEVATSYGIPVARVYDAFMGEGGIEDPRDYGLVNPDGLHPTPQGSTLIAELLRELGYDYAPDTP